MSEIDEMKKIIADQQADIFITQFTLQILILDLFQSSRNSAALLADLKTNVRGMIERSLSGSTEGYALLVFSRFESFFYSLEDAILKFQTMPPLSDVKN